MIDYATPNKFPTSFSQAVKWWEWRRLYFNGILLLVGIFSLFVAFLILDYTFGIARFPPILVIIGILLYAILANLCYTAGLVIEKLYPILDPETSHRSRQRLFLVGLLFSSLLTATPLWLAILTFILRIL